MYKPQEYKKICKICGRIIASGYITCEESIEYVIGYCCKKGELK